ncbi:hypothetical protein, partial [Holospora curviuscula]|uniref:hypothetical protein n=1 Tax=Holospora curviuscula TaxID=1082868 RepID=UPI00101AE358
MMAKLFWMRFFFWVDKKEDTGSSSVFHPSLIEGVRVEPFTDLSQASTAMTPLEGLHLSLQQGGFQGTQFKGQVRIEAREELLLSPALGQDGFEKVSVTRDTKILQKTQAHQGLEVAPRPEFTEIHRTVVPSITEESQRPRTTFKPAFKAALGVTLSSLTAVLTPTCPLAAVMVNSAAGALMQGGALEKAVNREALHGKDWQALYKDYVKRTAARAPAALVPGGALAQGAAGSAAQTVIYGGNPIKTIAS